MDTSTPSTTLGAAPKRSASVGAIPREKKHYTSRVESASGGPLDVRCGCQYFQCDSLLPDRINPVGSRPESKQEYVVDIPKQLFSEEFLLQTNNNNSRIQFDQLSTKSCMAPGRGGHHSDADRVSAKSFGGQKLFDQTSNRSFGGSRPQDLDMDEIKRRGLVVRSISDATEPGGIVGPVLSRNQRELSTDRISNRSFGLRDLDTISNKSGIGLRRISRPSSQQDLFIADINVPMQYGIHSRRSSKTEIPHFNIIAPTPTPTIGLKKPEFSVYEEFRQNKVNMETDKENLPGSSQNNFKQNQPIPIYQTSHNVDMSPSFNTSENIIKQKQLMSTNQTIERSREMSPSYNASQNIVKQNQLMTFSQSTERNNREMSPSSNVSQNIIKLNQPIPVSQSTERSNRELSPSSNVSQNIIKLNKPIPVSQSTERSNREMSPSYNASQNIIKQNQPIPVSQSTERSNREMSPSYNASQNIIKQNQPIPVSQSTERSNREMSPSSNVSKNIRKQNQPIPVSQSTERSNREMSSIYNESNNTVNQNQAISLYEPAVGHSNEMNPSYDTSTKLMKQNQSIPIYESSQSDTTLSNSSERNTVEIHKLPGNNSNMLEQNQQIPIYGPPTRQLNSPSMFEISVPPQEKVYQETTVPINQIEVPVMSIELETIITEHHILPKAPPIIVKEHPDEVSSSAVQSQSQNNNSFPPKQTLQQLKRHHEIDFDNSQIEIKQKPFQLSPSEPENKTVSRQSSFRKFFGNKEKLTDNIKTEAKAENSSIRERTPMRLFGKKHNIEHNSRIELGRQREKSKSPSRERSPARFLSRNKPELMMVSSDNMSMAMSVSEPKKMTMSNSQSNQPTSTTVHETFSLKVDELDQYAFKPKKINALPSTTSLQNLKVSNINLSDPQNSNRMNWPKEPSLQPSVDNMQIRQRPLKFQSRKITTSQPDISASKNFSNEISNQPIQQQWVTNQNKTLVSVNIGIDDDDVYMDDEQTIKGFIAEDQEYELSSTEYNEKSLITREIIDPSKARSPSEQRIMQSTLLHRKDYFDRTRSQDRTSLESTNDLASGRMMKTVSFDFAGHRSRIDEMDKLKRTSSKASDKSDWLERTYFKRDHEYEPIGEPQETTSILKKDASPVPQVVAASKTLSVDKQEEMQQAEELQRDLEDRYFTSSNATTPRTESRTDYDTHTSQVDSSALEELPLKEENRKKGFMSSAQDRSRKLKAGIRSQAGKVKTKFRRSKKQSSNTSGDSPKAIKETRKFKTPEFTKIKMPNMPKFKSPDMSKFKKPEFKKMEFKRPEFTKFNKPDMSKFKLPDKFSSLKLRRSKSFKEEEVTATSIQTGESGTTPESAATPAKKKFEFNFGTYPRALRRKKIKDSVEDISRANEVSTVPSTETPPSVKLTTVLRGTRAEGPVGSRWQDKFSDVSFGDSESGRFQRYGSEVESFDRESSMERRMKDDLVAQEENDLGAIGSVEHKQFADYDEENRAIHEISKIREGEFKQRRPMIHQDSNISEESKDVGWTDKDARRNKMLRQFDIENEAYNNKYASEDGLTGSVNTNHETQSTGSSGAKKGVIEEIDDDEFFLRKRGISQDNIEIRQYISSAIREGFDNPVNSLAQLGSGQDEYPESMLGSSQDQGDFGYDIPPAKPKRVKNYNNFNRKTDSQDMSQGYDEEQKENYDDNISLPKTGSDYFQNIPPSRPLRKSKKGYSQDSQSDIQNIPYFDDIDKEFYRKELNLENGDENIEELENIQPPQAPRRRKRQTRDSVEKDSFINGFGGRSVSNTFLQNDNQPDDVIVYRTEHAYVIPLAQSENSTSRTASVQRSRSATQNDEDERMSHEADSFASDAIQATQEEANEKFTIEIKGNDGYAVVRKEPPPRPPPPIRRKKYTQPSGSFATMPHPTKETPPPQRPKRGYSTIGPSRPPRRKTSFGSADLQNFRSASDITQYEELEEDELNEQAELQKDLNSGDVIKKMQHRPLPPPPPPPRGKKKHYRGDNRYKDDHDGDAEKMISDMQMNGNYDIEKMMEKCIEVEVSTQTDPLPDDFVCEEFEITDDMKVIEPRNSKTLEDLLREDQGNDLELNKWSAEDNLSKGIQRFRDANQKSFSEKSRNSSAADRSRSHSRPQTPSAIVVEKRIPTPVPNNASETMLQASLTVQPIDDLEFEEQFGDDYPRRTSYQTSPVKSVEDTAEDEKERLNEFIEEERRLRQQEEDRRIMEEIHQREEEEEREIMEKIRELQRLEEEEENKTMEKLRELEIEEENMKKSEQQREEDERLRREEEDRKVMEKIRELERQEEEDRQIMEKIRQLEREFADSSERSTEVDIDFRPEVHDYERRPTESPQPNIESYPDPEMEVIEAELSPHPHPPPRKRSSTNILPEDRPATATVESSSLSPVIENCISVSETTVSTAAVLPNRMAVADLEVERLRVHALQAGQIMVSNLHGAQIGADELECKSGNLVVRNLELPAGFIEDIVERVRISERNHIPAETQTIESGDTKTSELQSPPTQHDQPPERPPLPQQPTFPSEYMHSVPPASFFQLHDPTEEDYQPNMQAPRRRRHHRRRDSSSEDSHRNRSHSTRSPEPNVAQLGGQFLQACGTSLLRSMNQVANYVRTSQKMDSGERNIGILIVIFIFMILGYLFMAMSGKNIHHHHWDYFNPPGSDGRQQQ